MSRVKYSPEARNAIMANFVKVTKDIIESEGMDAVSIRRVSAAAGYSSATLYLYFEDVNELIMMSLISSLGAYTREIIATTPESETPREEYLRTWKIFCHHAFSNPRMFYALFYGSQSQSLDFIANKYYELFPDELENASLRMLSMLASGSLASRNHAVLDSFASDLGLTEEQTELANDLTIAYFRSFLEEIGDQKLTETEIEEHTDRFIQGTLFVLRDTEDA